MGDNGEENGNYYTGLWVVVKIVVPSYRVRVVRCLHKAPSRCFSHLNTLCQLLCAAQQVGDATAVCRRRASKSVFVGSPSYVPEVLLLWCGA